MFASLCCFLILTVTFSIYDSNMFVCSCWNECLNVSTDNCDRGRRVLLFSIECLQIGVVSFNFHRFGCVDSASTGYTNLWELRSEASSTFGSDDKGGCVGGYTHSWCSGGVDLVKNEMWCWGMSKEDEDTRVWVETQFGRRKGIRKYIGIV